ncbi:MAG: glycosyltransferase WbuB, partial [Rikenellaceae bacterium]|nr:glycosyltransferase WbuB [Rikenellaceae bacterium]
MRVLFLSISPVWQIEQRGIYTDLLRKFRNEGVEVYVVTPAERRFGLKTQLAQIDGVNILKVRTLNVQHTNLIEKGIATLLLEWQFKRAIKRFLSGISFDLILYTTPPITLGSVIGYLKRQNPNAISYLLLKDIFPQNAVDLGMFSK